MILAKLVGVPKCSLIRMDFLPRIGESLELEGDHYTVANIEYLFYKNSTVAGKLEGELYFQVVPNICMTLKHQSAK